MHFSFQSKYNHHSVRDVKGRDSSMKLKFIYLVGSNHSLMLDHIPRSMWGGRCLRGLYSFCVHSCLSSSTPKPTTALTRGSDKLRIYQATIKQHSPNTQFCFKTNLITSFNLILPNYHFHWDRKTCTAIILALFNQSSIPRSWSYIPPVRLKSFPHIATRSVNWTFNNGTEHIDNCRPTFDFLQHLFVIPNMHASSFKGFNQDDKTRWEESIDGVVRLVFCTGPCCFISVS